jgi:tetratricopeptide (TPR) repeat protein
MEEFDTVKRERERKIVEIVRNFLLASQAFREHYRKYKQDDLHFSDFAKFVDDRGQSILFPLKENCQDLFRRGSSFLSEREQTFDLTISSIFHLAMRMREDLYQLEVYGPKYLKLNASNDPSPEKENLIREFRKIITRTESSLKEGMEEVDLLFQGVFRQFKELLVEYRENGLLLRFFLDESDLLKEVLEKDALEEIFRILFGQDEVQGYCLAGESYFQSAFYTQAVKAFSRALEKRLGDENLQFKIYLSQGMEQFYSFSLQQALRSFEKCLHLAGKVEFLETHRAMIRRICQKIQEEFPGRRKTDQHRDLVKKAKNLQRQLDELPPAPADIHPA